MTKLVTANLALLAAAPDGVALLRALTWRMAIEGKLVPQIDESPSVHDLLAQLDSARATFYAVSGQRPAKVDDGVEAGPFALQSGWTWVRLASVAHPQAGFAFKSSGFNEVGDGLPLIRIRDIGQRFSGTYFAGEFRSEFLVARGDYLISMDGEFRVAAWAGDNALLNQRVTRLQFFGDLVDRRFVALSLQARLTELQGVKTYTTVDHLSGGQIANAVIGLPPLAEQHRIVAKVDELMALCDRLEARQQDAEAAHTQLVKALLDSLTQARDADDFRAGWQRLSGAFDSIFTTTASVDALRRSILNLAADGKLVKAESVAQQLPISQVLIGDTLNGCSRKPSEEPGGSQILRISAGTGSDDFYVDEGDYKWVKLTDAEREKFRLSPNDLLACRFNGNLRYVGSFSMYRGVLGREQVFPDKLIRFRADPELASPHYLRFVMNAAPARRQIEAFCATTVGNIGISASNLKTVTVRVPPLAEQHRIVAKVDELFALCDQLKARIAAAREKHAQLADALVAQAVAV